MDNLHTMLQSRLRRRWLDNAVCNYDGTSYTGRDAAKRIEMNGILLEKSGIGRNDKVAVCGRNSAEWGLAFLSSYMHGSITVTLLQDYFIDDIARLVSHSGAKAAFIDPEIWERLDRDSLADLRLAVSLSDFSILWKGEDVADIDIEYEFDIRHPFGFRQKDVTYVPVDGKSITIINYTSGTTSSPKGVMIRDESVSSNILYALDKIPVTERDTMVSMLPMAHMFGLMFEFLYPLCGGATVIFMGTTPSPTHLVRAMQDVRPYLLITVPIVIEKIISSRIIPLVHGWAMKRILSMPYVGNVVLRLIGRRILSTFGGNIREIIMGGAALNPETEMWCRKLHLPYSVGYGMTECAPLISFERYSDYVEHSCGKAVDRMEVRVASEDPSTIAGEIEVRGVNVTSGYYRNPEETSRIYTSDGWMRTGDLGVIDHDGNIFIRGRSKNMILGTNGQNIYPEEIEAMINSIRPVAESIVVCRNSRLVALIHLSPDDGGRRNDGETAQRVIAEANSRLPQYSQIAYAELFPVPFEKTPKMSIKRFLYS